MGFSVAANTATAARTGTLTIAGDDVHGDAGRRPACTYSHLRRRASRCRRPAARGSSAVTARRRRLRLDRRPANASWITDDQRAHRDRGRQRRGSPRGRAMTAATGRTGTLTAAGSTFTVTQAAACSYAISPASQSLPAAGGTGSSAVTTAAGCAWTATSNSTWITVTGGASGSGTARSRSPSPPTPLERSAPAR